MRFSCKNPDNLELGTERVAGFYANWLKNSALTDKHLLKAVLDLQVDLLYLLFEMYFFFIVTGRIYYCGNITQNVMSMYVEHMSLEVKDSHQSSLTLVLS